MRHLSGVLIHRHRGRLPCLAPAVLLAGRHRLLREVDPAQQRAEAQLRAGLHLVSVARVQRQLGLPVLDQEGLRAMCRQVRRWKGEDMAADTSCNVAASSLAGVPCSSGPLNCIGGSSHTSVSRIPCKEN